MALSGSFSCHTAHQNAYSLRVSWRATQNTGENSSTVVFTLQFVAGAWVGNVPTNIGERSDNTGQVGGNRFAWHSARVALGGVGSVTLAEKTVVVPHAEDGTASFHAAFTYRSRAAIDNLTTADSMTAEADITLDTIQRGATATIAPSLVPLGGSATLTVTPRTAGESYTARYRFGALSGRIGSEKTTETTLEWSPPLVLAAEMPESVYGTGEITLETWRGGCLAGSTTCPFTVSVPMGEATAPVVSLTVQPENATAPFEGLLLRGITRAHVTLQAAAATAGGRALSAITAHRVTVGGVSEQALEFDIGPFYTTGELVITAEATDARGYRSTVRRTLTVLPYEMPAVVPPTGQSAVELWRADDAGQPSANGSYLRVLAGRRIATLGGRNTGSLRLRYKAADGGSYSAWQTLLEPGGEAVAVADRTLALGLSPDRLYLVELAASDLYGRESLLACRLLPTGVTLHLREGGMGAAFGKAAEADRLLDVAWDQRVRGDLMVDGALSAPSATLSGALAAGSLSLGHALGFSQGGTSATTRNAALHNLTEAAQGTLTPGSSTSFDAAASGSLYLVACTDWQRPGLWLVGGADNNSHSSFVLPLVASSLMSVTSDGSASRRITLAAASTQYNAYYHIMRLY